MKLGCSCCSIVFGHHVRVAAPSSESLAGALVDHQLRRGSIQKGAQAVHGEEVVGVTGRCDDSLEKTLAVVTRRYADASVDHDRNQKVGLLRVKPDLSGVCTAYTKPNTGPIV